MWTKNEVDATISKINDKAATDLEFRKLCLNNPNEAVGLISGKPVPDGYKIKMIESEPGYDYTHILPELHNQTISDEELSMISGGTDSCRRDQCQIYCPKV